MEPALKIQLQLVAPTDRLLNKNAKPLSGDEIQNPKTQKLIDQMIALAKGQRPTKRNPKPRQMVGLAAPQVGVSNRILIIDLSADGAFHDTQNLVTVINPKIARRSRATVPGREGCWSCGNICGNVRRAREVTLEGLDRHGKPIRYELTDFTARIAQHETDHLDGIRFPDRIPKGKPEHLHWVEPEQFQDYREQWMHWSHLCPPARWERMKAGDETYAKGS